MNIKCETCNGTGTIALDTIGNRLAYYRKITGLTQREVEKATGIKNTNICQMEKGVIESPSFETVMKLAKLYEIDPYLLLGNT